MKSEKNKKPVRGATIASWVTLALTVGLVFFFVIKTGMFASLFGQKPEPVVDMPLPDQVASGVSTITGFDKDQQPYKLTAQSVLQDEKLSDIAHLKTVTGVLRRKSGKKLEISALGGTYDARKKRLDLVGKIRIISETEYTAFLEKTHVILKEKRMYANVPVSVIFDRGTIRSNGVDISDNGNRVLFFGRVKTRFNSAESAVNSGKTDRKGEKKP